MFIYTLILNSMSSTKFLPQNVHFVLLKVGLIFIVDVLGLKENAPFLPLNFSEVRILKTRNLQFVTPQTNTPEPVCETHFKLLVDGFSFLTK